ncbi:hypothetical protein ACQP1W_40420 [Spirillospora sp. CA-255316]
MICQACRDDRHGECRGGSWCDCQHQPSPATRRAAPGTAPEAGADGGPDGGTDGGAEGGRRGGERSAGRSEPPVNWKRQG